MGMGGGGIIIYFELIGDIFHATIHSAKMRLRGNDPKRIDGYIPRTI
jgi:hypothetical protein